MWQEKPHSPVPLKFRKEIPIYEVLQEYELTLPRESLIVQKAFSLNAGDMLNIRYEGPECLEWMIISRRKISHVESKLVALMVEPPTNSDLSEEEFLRQMGEFFSQPNATQNPPTYHNIKKFEDYLKELPDDCQNDLSPIYKGDGIFRI